MVAFQKFVYRYQETGSVRSEFFLPFLLVTKNKYHKGPTCPFLMCFENKTTNCQIVFVPYQTEDSTNLLHPEPRFIIYSELF